MHDFQGMRGVKKGGDRTVIVINTTTHLLDSSKSSLFFATAAMGWARCMVIKHTHELGAKRKIITDDQIRESKAAMLVTITFSFSTIPHIHLFTSHFHYTLPITCPLLIHIQC